jgi:hypothetical protein
MQLRYGRRDQDPAKDRPPTPTSLSRLEDLRCQKYDHSPNSEDCECRWSRTWLQKAHCNASAASDLDTRSVTAETRPVRRVWRLPPLRWVLYPREQPQCHGCGGNHMANHRFCIKWKEAKAALAKQAPERARKSAATGQPAAPKAQRAGPSAEQMELGEGWNHVVRGGVLSRAPSLRSQIPLLSRSRRRRSSLK